MGRRLRLVLQPHVHNAHLEGVIKGSLTLDVLTSIRRNRTPL